MHFIKLITMIYIKLVTAELMIADCAA